MEMPPVVTWVRFVLTNGVGYCRNFVLMVIASLKLYDSLHRIMSNGLSTTKAAIAINSEVPSTANSLDLLILNASTASLSYVDVSSTSTGGA
jgi:hypothetical protein